MSQISRGVKRKSAGVIGIASLLVAALACSSMGAASASTKVKLTAQQKADLAKTYKITFASGLAPTDATGETFYTFAKLVSQKTKGHVKVTVYPSAQLGTDAATISQTQLGQIQMAQGTPQLLSAYVPQFSIVALPFIFTSDSEALTAVRSKAGQKLDAELQAKGLRVLSWGSQGFSELVNARHSINAISDMSGLKFRSVGDKFTDLAFTTLGAVPTVIPYTEEVTDIATNVIDGEYINLGYLLSSGNFSVEKYVTMINLTWVANCVVINNKFFNSLPAAYQADVKAAATEAASVSDTNEQLLNQTAVASLQNDGVTVTVPSASTHAAFQTALQPVYKQAGYSFGPLVRTFESFATK